MRRPLGEVNFNSEQKEGKKRYSVEDLSDDKKLKEISVALAAILKSRNFPARGSFDIDDLVQDVIIRAREKSSEVNDPNNIMPWLGTIAIRKQINETFRKKNNNTGLVSPDEFNVEGDEKILKSLINRQYVDIILNEIIPSFKTHKDAVDKQAIWKMKMLDELSYENIARKVNMKETAVRVIVHRLNRNIIKYLKNKGLLGGLINKI